MVVTTLISTHDERETRCPMLGHGVPFNYCRKLQTNLPCRKIADCWFETFDIKAYLLRHFNHQEIKEFTRPSQPKLASLIELMEKAQKTIDQ